MANTRDTLGDQETLDALVSQTLVSFEEDGIKTPAQYSLYRNTGLVHVKLPNVTSTAQYMFYNCTNLEDVDLGSAGTIGAYTFGSCSKLNAVLLRKNTMATLRDMNAFFGTPIAVAKGAIYVPTDLVATYQANTNWKNYFIIDINDYPVTDYSTIKDSWAEIFAAEADGTYSTKYAVGDTKKITINGVDDYMQIVAMDTDDLADGSGKAKITWISKGLFANHAMNSNNTTVNGWAATEMRTWLRETILPTLDSVIRSNIKEVTKTYRIKSPNDETLSVTDTLWIPSYKEVGFTTASYVENDGVVYSGFFTGSSARVKYYTDNTAQTWWLRSAYNVYSFSYVSNNGINSYTGADSTLGVALGFCT